MEGRCVSGCMCVCMEVGVFKLTGTVVRLSSCTLHAASNHVTTSLESRFSHVYPIGMHG